MYRAPQAMAVSACSDGQDRSRAHQHVGHGCGDLLHRVFGRRRPERDFDARNASREQSAGKRNGIRRIVNGHHGHNAREADGLQGCIHESFPDC